MVDDVRSIDEKQVPTDLNLMGVLRPIPYGGQKSKFSKFSEFYTVEFFFIKLKFLNFDFGSGTQNEKSELSELSEFCLKNNRFKK